MRVKKRRQNAAGFPGRESQLWCYRGQAERGRRCNEQRAIGQPLFPVAASKLQIRDNAGLRFAAHDDRYPDRSAPSVFPHPAAPGTVPLLFVQEGIVRPGPVAVQDWRSQQLAVPATGTSAWFQPR